MAASELAGQGRAPAAGSDDNASEPRSGRTVAPPGVDGRGHGAERVASPSTGTGDHGGTTDEPASTTSGLRTVDPSDRDLLAAHAGGDPQAFSELVRRHRDRLWAVALRTLGDREEAADALQDALLSAYRAAGTFRGDAAVTTWLHRIVVNACLDRVRRRQVRPTVPLPETGPHEPVQPGDPMAERETAIDVREALATLPVEQRAALVLLDVQGHSVVEVAAILGVAPGTVKSRCARGRARLAVLLGHLRNPDGPDRVVPPGARPPGGDTATPREGGGAP